MLKTIALASIFLLTTGTAISQDKWGKTVIDSSILQYYGDTVYIYEPGYVVKIGKRLMSLDGVESELHAYKTLYSHCDSLKHIQDSAHIAKDTAFVRCESLIAQKETTNDILRGFITNKDKEISYLSQMYATERKKSRRQKYIYGFSGTGAGIIGGLILGIILR